MGVPWVGGAAGGPVCVRAGHGAVVNEGRAMSAAGGVTGLGDLPVSVQRCMGTVGGILHVLLVKQAFVLVATRAHMCFGQRPWGAGRAPVHSPWRWSCRGQTWRL